MSEYINRDEAYQRLHAAGGCDAADEWSKGYDDGITEAIRIINEMSAANVAPVVPGHWKNIKMVEWGKCSNCDRCYKVTRYCPFCGAEMSEREDTGNE